jgi:adenine/guanine phosphoribosyltransferase-like PRPP-binding protein
MPASSGQEAGSAQPRKNSGSAPKKRRQKNRSLSASNQSRARARVAHHVLDISVSLMVSPDLKESRARRGKLKWERRLLRTLARAGDLECIADALATPFRGSDVHMVAAFEALGLPLGTAIAHTLNSGIVCVRKIDDHATRSGFDVEPFRDYDNEEKLFGILRSSLTAGARVLIVDDYLETAAQVRAAITLIERLQGKIVGIAVIGRAQRSDVDLCDLDRYPIHDLGREIDSYILPDEPPMDLTS